MPGFRAPAPRKNTGLMVDLTYDPREQGDNEDGHHLHPGSTTFRTHKALYRYQDRILLLRSAGPCLERNGDKTYNRQEDDALPDPYRGSGIPFPDGPEHQICLHGGKDSHSPCRLVFLRRSPDAHCHGLISDGRQFRFKERLQKTALRSGHGDNGYPVDTRPHQ